MFKLFDRKGQSSSVFNLLIAALVSLAILGLLLSIMGVIDISGAGKNPSSIATTLVSNAMSGPLAPQTDTITFTTKYKGINAKAVSAKTEAGADSVFFYNCTNDDPSIKADEEEKKFINFDGSSSKRYTLTVICGAGIKQDELNSLGITTECDKFDPDTSRASLDCHLLLYPYIG